MDTYVRGNKSLNISLMPKQLIHKLRELIGRSIRGANATHKFLRVSEASGRNGVGMRVSQKLKKENNVTNENLGDEVLQLN